MPGPSDDDDSFVLDDDADFDPPLDEPWQDQFDDDPNPYAGTFSED